MNKEQITSETIVLQIQQVYQQMALDNRTINCANVQFGCYLEAFVNSFQVSMKARMMGQAVDKHIYPATWLDAFKLRWFPKWLLKRFPANEIEVRTWECYPEYRLPDWGDAVQFFVIKNSKYFPGPKK